MRHPSIRIPALFLILTLSLPAVCGVAGSAIRETAELIVSKFGRGVAGQTLEDVTEATTKAVTRFGDDVLPLLRKSGHAGFTALEEAGAKAPDVIKLCARKGDEAILIVTDPKKLALFVKYGDPAADVLLKHPGIADTLIGRFGDNAVGALNKLSRQSAQRLGMVADDGLLIASPRSPELLSVIRRYGDEAMDFIWKNKGPLAVASILATFLADPPSYIDGAKELGKEIAEGINWNLIIVGVLVVVFLPFIARSLMGAISAMKSKKNT